ncbi:MAG: hypothetical protein LBF95_03085 [Treponema sp.]|jgi:hypothetical protein|nr:hypothetical protein [Treponema sp.]
MEHITEVLMKGRRVLPRTLPVLTVVVLLSCVSESGGGSWNSYSGAPAQWDYRAGGITVVVDHVPEEGIASQIRVMAETFLAGGGKNNAAKKNGTEAGGLMLIDMRVEQRSFLHDVELLNAIYIDCLIRDEEGRVFGREYEYRVGKGSILSTREQERLCGIVLKRILAGRRKHYRQPVEVIESGEHDG